MRSCLKRRCGVRDFSHIHELGRRRAELVCVSGLDRLAGGTVSVDSGPVGYPVSDRSGDHRSSGRISCRSD